MKREDIKKIFPDATEEQLKGLLDINTADIGKAKGELEAVKADLEKANGTLKEYETTIADMKKSAEGNEDFKKKFEELEQRIADEKAAAERKAKEEAEEACLLYTSCRDAGNPHHQSIPDAWRQQFFCILQLQPTEKPEQLGKPGVLTAEGKPLGAYL